MARVSRNRNRSSETLTVAAPMVQSLADAAMRRAELLLVWAEEERPNLPLLRLTLIGDAALFELLALELLKAAA